MGIDEEFIKVYPRLYPIAHAMGIEKEWFDDLFEKLDNSNWIREQLNHNDKQLYMRMILARFDYFDLPFNLNEYKDVDDETIERVFGKFPKQFAKELLKTV